MSGGPLESLRNTLAAVSDGVVDGKRAMSEITTFSRVSIACQIIGMVALVGIFVTIAVLGSMKLKLKAA